MIRKILFLVLALLALGTPSFADVMSQPFVFTQAVRHVVVLTSGTVSQTLLAANNGRKMFCVTNYASATESVWIDYNEAAVVGSSQEVPASTTLCFGGSAIYTNAITFNATTTSHQVTVFEYY